MGTYRKKLQGTAQYTSFIPAPLSTVHVEEELLAPFVSEAQEAIDQLNQTLCKLEEEEVQKSSEKKLKLRGCLLQGNTFSLLASRPSLPNGMKRNRKKSGN